MHLRRAHIVIERPLDDGAQFLGAFGAYLAALRPCDLRGQILPCHVNEGTVEYWHVVLEAETNVGVIVEGPVLGGLYVRGLEGIGLVAVGLGELDAAIPVAMPYVGSTEDNKAGFKLLFVDNERHSRLASVQFLCREAGLSA